MARAGVSALFHSVVRGGAHEAAHVAPHLASEAAHVAPRLGEDATHAATSGLHVTQDVLHDTATSAARDVTADTSRNVGGSELRAASREGVHEATDVAVARAKASSKWKSKLAMTGPAYIGAGAAAYGVYSTNQRVGQIGSALAGGLGQTRRDASNAARAMAEHARDGANSFANHMPNLSDIEDVAKRAMDGAHHTVDNLAGPASTALTIGLVLGTAVVAYEGYRYFAR